MLQAEADLAEELSNYAQWQDGIIRAMRLINARYDMQQDSRSEMTAQIAVDTVLDAVSLAFKTGSALISAINDFADGKDSSGGVTKAVADMIPSDTGEYGLSDGVGDIPTAPIKGAVELVGATAKFGLQEAGPVILDALSGATDIAKQIGDMVIELNKFDIGNNFDLKQALSELQTDLENENTRRIEMFKKEQAIDQLSQQYRATLAKGFRLIQERINYNKKVAALTQRNRYQDMTFRVARNAALEKYRSAFDLAARYTYLAATAYDYDTNLGKDDAGSPIDIRADIVRQRTLGVLNDVTGQPAFGAGGLSEDLAWMKANYESLKFRMGLNNYQQESTTFSLRYETFRTLLGTNVGSDDKWRAALGNFPIYRTNLWDLPEFRAYCRPFAPETNGPQPGLVIEFKTEIISGKNFFGWPLSGGDNAYNPSFFATKIDQIGVWFANYDVGNNGSTLSATPRVYLIPVGQDIMTVPTSQNLEVRIWNVLDQAIPVPYPSISASLSSPTYKPFTDSLAGSLHAIHKFSSLLAAGFDHDTLTADDTVPFDYRLVGRSAWNTRWLLIIPGATLNSDPDAGLRNFISSITDLKLVLATYASSGN